MARVGEVVYVSDFETVVNPKKSFVWLWGNVSMKNEVFTYGTTIESYLEEISRVDCTAYFHNLKFDAQFIIYYLLTNDYTHVDRKKLKPGQFSTLISDMGLFYNVKVCFKNGNTVTFLDSMKEINLAVEKMPKAFGLDIEKLSIDYDAVQTKAHEPTHEEIEYVKHDVLVVKRSLEKMHEQGLIKHTAASNALYNFKRLTGKKDFEHLFPNIGLIADNDCRKAYKGGWTYLNPKYAGQMIGEGMVYDVNSMYPWVMSKCLLPYGTPQYYQGFYKEDPLFPLFIQSLTLTFHLKPGKYPCIQIKNSPRFLETEYLTDSDEAVTLVVTSVDYKLIIDSYDVEILEYNGGYKFMGSTTLFREYVEYWYDVKSTAKMEDNSAMMQIAKLMLNSLYGKFGTNPIKRSKYPYYDPENDIVKYEYGPKEETAPLYVPVAAFITAYARDRIVRGADACGERFVYADTDSLHILGSDIPDIDIDSLRLGAFDHEASFTRAKYLRAKCYIEEIDGELVKKCAGLPDEARDLLNFDTLERGNKFSGKLSFSIVSGGAVLKVGKYTLK